MPPDETVITRDSGEARFNAGIKSSVIAYTPATFTAKFVSNLDTRIVKLELIIVRVN